MLLSLIHLVFYIFYKSDQVFLVSFFNLHLILLFFLVLNTFISIVLSGVRQCRARTERSKFHVYLQRLVTGWQRMFCGQSGCNKTLCLQRHYWRGDVGENIKKLRRIIL